MNISGARSRCQGENTVVHPAATAGLGFLLAVLWFDLMFDVQAARPGAGSLSRDVAASISGYYRRVTTTARPMNWLVAAVMLVTLAALSAEIWIRSEPRWAAWVSLGLAAIGVGLAAVRTVNNAARLGGATDDLPTQSELARSILRDHVTCALAVGAALVMQLAVMR